MMYEINKPYSGKFEKVIPSTTAKISYKFIIASSPDIPCNKDITDPLCKVGCKNYNNKYSCPPYSPDFNKLKQPNNAIILILYMNVNTFNCGNSYFNVDNCNRTLVPLLDKISYIIEEQTSGTFYKSGACKLCQKCTASLTPPQPCKHPDKRRFPMEGCGILVNDLTEKYLSHTLLWYHCKKNPLIPYTSVVSLITNPIIKETLNINDIISSIKGVQSCQNLT